MSQHNLEGVRDFGRGDDLGLKAERNRLRAGQANQSGTRIGSQTGGDKRGGLSNQTLRNLN